MSLTYTINNKMTPKIITIKNVKCIDEILTIIKNNEDIKNIFVKLDEIVNFIYKKSVLYSIKRNKTTTLLSIGSYKYTNLDKKSICLHLLEHLDIPDKNIFVLSNSKIPIEKSNVIVLNDTTMCDDLNIDLTIETTRCVKIV